LARFSAQAFRMMIRVYHAGLAVNRLVRVPQAMRVVQI
jgi:hypothetical protein